MPVFNPLHNLSALRTQLDHHQNLVIVCYCAQWCDTCKKYQDDFERLADQCPQHAFVWIDIEENPELLGDEDVENFPTLLIQDRQKNLFFGTLLPYISHLERLIGQFENTDADRAVQGPPLLRSLVAAATQ